MQSSTEAVRVVRTKFKKWPPLVHNRSEGLTHRRNAGSKFQVAKKDK